MTLRFVRRFTAGALCLFAFLPAAFADGDSAQIVSVRPSGHVVSSARKEPAAVSRTVAAGDELQTDAYGRMSVLLPNQLLLKVAEETRFLYEGPAGGGVGGKLLSGKVWIRGQKQPVPFELETPTATAAIRGTEWYVEVAKDGTTRVGVIDGVVEVSNPLGSVELRSRDLALVEPGKAPVKLAYVTPENAVNWTLNYFGLWEKADFARGGTLAPGLERIIDAYYRSDFEEAERVLDAMRSSESASAYQAARGFLSMVSAKEAEARRWFERARASDPSWALPPAHLSLIALVENDLDRAVSLADEAVRVQGASAVAHIARAYALKGQLKLENAYEEARLAVDLAPRFQEAILIASQIALEMDRPHEARRYLDQASDAAPLQGRKRTLEGYLALRTKEGEAREYFERALAAEPDSPDALVGLGIALFQENRSEEAIGAITRATLLAPQVSDYQSYLAKAYAEIGREAEAEQVLARARRLDPKDPTPYLYEALIEQARFRPGRAFMKLLEARKRNDNRAVLRSKYLLDEDRSVLTSNLAQVYHEIGFDHSATQESARALELDPTNPAAHRRQFFALQFDPRGYAQAGSSERLLNNMFMLPTRTGVVVSEEFLSPYQNTFDRPGIDPVLRGRAGYDSTDDEESRLFEGSGILAAEFNEPLAIALELGGGRESANSSGISRLEPRLTDEDRDQDNLTGRAFLKWQITPSTEVFGEFRVAGVDRSRTGEEVLQERLNRRRRGKAADMSPPPPPGGVPPSEGPSNPPSSPPPSSAPPNNQPPSAAPPAEPTDSGPPAVAPEGSNAPSGGPPPPDGGPPPDGPPPEMVPAPEFPELPEMPSLDPSDIESDVTSDVYDADIGLHSKLGASTDALFHLSYHGSDDTVENTRSDGARSLSETEDNGFDSWIAQGALWQRLGEQHFAQLGVRHYDQDITADLSQEEEPGMPQRTREGNDATLDSVFVVDQYRGIPNVTFTAGVNVDALDFEMLDGRSDSNTEVGPSAGIAWEFLPGTFMRAAAIHNAAGDRNERLQQTLIAGFPWQRLTLIDPYSEEQLFNLTYETYVFAMDTYFEDPVVFVGMELEHDHQRTESFVETGENEKELLLNNSERARLYLESLLTPEWSVTLTYRFDTFEFPDTIDRHGVAFSTAYFTNEKLAFRLTGQYLNLQSAGVDTFEGEGDDKGLTLVPAIDGYPFGNRLRTTLQAPFNDEGEYSLRVNFFWYLNS